MADKVPNRWLNEYTPLVEGTETTVLELLTKAHQLAHQAVADEHRRLTRKFKGNAAKDAAWVADEYARFNELSALEHKVITALSAAERLSWPS